MDFAGFKEQVRSASNIVEIIGERVPLKRVGSRYVGRCPFHTEKTPSFSVNANMQIYKCFGCGVSGDVFKFIQEFDHVTFVEAVKWVAERYGIPIPKRTDAGDPDTAWREALYRMNEAAQRQFRALLTGPQGGEARAYLQSRGVTPQIAEEFGIGLADRSGQALTQLLQREGFGAEALENSGLILKRQEGGGLFDRFRGRLMFPIHSEAGKLVGFAGRAMAKGDEPKYLNSPETTIYRKSQLLYNLNRAKELARKAGRLVLVEGYMDVIGLWAGGIREVVASCGTALTALQVKMMRRLCETVVVNFDPDAAGQNATERSLQVLLDEHMRVRVLELNQDLDPDEYIKQFGQEMYLRLIEQAPNYYYWLADRAKQRFDSRTAEGRQQALKFLLPAVHRIPDKIERAGVADDLASYLGVERGMVLEAFKKAALDRRQQDVKVAPAPLVPAERILLKALMHHPEVRPQVLPRVRALHNLEQLRSKSLLLAMGSLWELQPDFRYADLEPRLEGNDAALLSEVVFADEIPETEDTEAARANAMASIETLEMEGRAASLDSLRQQIRQAQQKGDMQAALVLLEQLDRLQRETAGSRARPRSS
jgi:DNA primase